MVFTRAQRERKQTEEDAVGVKGYFAANRKADREHIHARNRLKRNCRSRNTRQGTHSWQEDPNSEDEDFEGKDISEIDTDSDHSFHQESEPDSEAVTPATSQESGQTQPQYVGVFQAQDVGLSQPQPQEAGSATPLPQLNSLQLGKPTPTPKSFRDLPAELLQIIANKLPSDKDVLNFSMTTKKARDLINNGAYWRVRFENLFDHVQAKGLDTAECDKLGEERATHYMYRQHNSKALVLFCPNNLTRYGVTFHTQISQAWRFSLLNCVEVVRGLIEESDGETGKNLKFIQDWIVRPCSNRPPLDILDAVFKTPLETTTSIPRMRKFSKVEDWLSSKVRSEGILHAVQLCLTPLSLDTKYSDVHRAPVAHFDVSQWVAYATEGICAGFKGAGKEKVNIEMFLHIVNFFKFHLKTRCEGIVEHMFRGLPKDQLPKLWDGRLTGETQILRPHWKGVHTFLSPDDLGRRRNTWTEEDDDVFSDNYESNEAFQDIGIFFDPKRMNSGIFPGYYGQVLKTNPFLKSKFKGDDAEPSPAVEYLWGSSRLPIINACTSHFMGALHALPAQNGVVGFQRITFLMFCTRKQLGMEVYDQNGAWFYEGLVLPGGAMIVGRWYNRIGYAPGVSQQFGNFQSGPFLWWNVDRCDSTRPIDLEEAFAFFDAFDI